MADEIQPGNNEPSRIVSDPVAAAKAQLEAFEKQSAGQFPEVPQRTEPNAAPTVQAKPEVNPPPVTAPDAKKTDGLQQFRNKDGEVDPSLIEKANQHLEKGIQSKEERIKSLLGKNKELMQKFTKTSQEAKQAEAKPPEPVQPIRLDNLTPELKQKFAEKLQADPVAAILEIGQLAARNEVTPLASEWQNTKQDRIDRRMAEELDSLVDQGHSWIQTEGLERFEKVFQQKPYLRQSETPYSDALRFMDVPQGNGTQPGQAQPGPKTPILGSNTGVPPSSFQAPVSTEQSMNNLSTQITLALQRGDRKSAMEYQKQLDEVTQKAYPASRY